MTGILLAMGFGLATALLMTSILRRAQGKGPLKRLAMLYLAGVAALAICTHLVLSPPGAGHWLAVGFACFLYTAGFWGGLVQLYNLADRGLSLRMLIDAVESPGSAVTASGIVSGYAAGRGLAWMYEKRLSGLARTGLIERRDGMASITARGRSVARLMAPGHRLFDVALPVNREGKA